MATRMEFEECMTQDDACYIYYTDDDGNMHFIADIDSDSEHFHCDSVKDAMLCPYRLAQMLKVLADVIFSDEYIVHHIVRLHMAVEWV